MSIPNLQEKLTQTYNEELSGVIQKMASDGLRTIGLAYADFAQPVADWSKEDTVERDLTLIGIVGIRVMLH